MPNHSETRTLPYSARQMYDLVADVARYPEFIPWTIATRVRSVEPVAEGHSLMLADMVVGFRMFRETFVSRVDLYETRLRIDTAYVDGPFRHLLSNWEFVPVPAGRAAGSPLGCEVRFKVDFEFRNRLLQGAAGLFFLEAMQRIVRAFEARAEALYRPDTASA